MIGMTVIFRVRGFVSGAERACDNVWLPHVSAKNASQSRTIMLGMNERRDDSILQGDTDRTHVRLGEDAKEFV